MFRFRLIAWTFVFGTTPLLCQTHNPDVPEPGSREAIAAATTEPRFLSPWVADVPESATVPSPTKFLGHIAGAPGELTRTEKLYAYYRALAAVSPRVKVEVIGKTEEGRDILLVIAGSEENLKNLSRMRADMADLTEPRHTDETAMEQIVARTKPFYMLNGGLHSTETGSPEMLMELAYRLAVSEAPHIREIRDNVVVLINPVSEPDGHDRQVDWFYRHLKGKTDFDNLPPRSAPFWGKYVFHDNNRDGTQRKLALTRALQDAFLKYRPVVLLDLHESIPLLMIWTGTGPYNENIDPSVFTEWHTLAFYEVTALTAQQMPGVWTWGFSEGWAHVYADSVAMNHNAIGRGYETFGNATAETVERVLEKDRGRFLGKPVTERDWYRTLPPPRRFKWSLRNSTNYMETGVLAGLQYAARNGKEMLRNYWRRGHTAVRKGETEKPFAVAIPEKQDDRRRLAHMVNLLREQGIEVSRAKEAFTVKEGSFDAGTYLVRLDQPFRGYALDLLIPQKYPAETAPYEPYDDVAWDLPSVLSVEIKLINDQAVRRLSTLPVTEPVTYQGSIEGDGTVYLVKDTGQETLLAARTRLFRFKVEAAEKAFASGGVDYPAGSWIIPGQPGLRKALESVAVELTVDFAAADAAPSVPRHPLDLPRLALLQTWTDTQSAGWLRMLWDEERIPYTLIMDDDVKRGGLRARFDVIVFPNTDDDLKDMVNGFDSRFGPIAYTKTVQFPTHGFPAASPDITGGLTWRGIGNLEDFVRQGGVLVTLGGASALPLDGGIARDVSHARTKNLFTPGSELRARFRRPDHPIAYGYKETTSVFREDRTAYSVRRVDEGRIVLQWGVKPPKDDDETEAEKDERETKGEKKEDALVVSGGIKGGSELEGKPAILDIATGKGRVVTFDFDPIHRYTTVSDFRLVWNVVLNWNDLPPTPPSR